MNKMNIALYPFFKPPGGDNYILSYCNCITLQEQNKLTNNN